MKAKSFFSLAAAVAASVLVASTAFAQANATLARSYRVTPKAGMTAQFEAALREHARWRAENGDPWDWTVSTYETGEHVGAYSTRSGGHTWADFDAYDAGFGPKGGMHWNATVAPLVESTTSTISTTNQALSKPPPEGSWTFVTVTRFSLRPGQEGEFNRLVAQAIGTTRDKMEGNFVLFSPISGGGPGPYIGFAAFAASWADMAEPDPSFDEIMMQELGAEAFQEWGAALGRTFRGVETYTLRLRPDLGVN